MPVKDQIDSEETALRALAPAGHYVGLHIRNSTPLISLIGYPQAWMIRYMENGYTMRDPVVAWGFSQSGVSRWSDVNIPDPFGILEEAKEFGITFGAVVSIGLMQSRTIAGAARSDREFTDDELVEVADIVQRLHDLSTPPKKLTRMQIEALKLIATGQRYAEAAASLGISESALKARLTTVRENLAARTTAEAIQRAKDYGLM